MRLILFMLILGLSASFAQTTPIQAKILEFSKNNLGKKVDRGECWDLANAALNYADADWKSPYNFGTEFDPKKQKLQAADILQFSNVKFILKNGSMSFPKHTAIIYKVNKNEITVYHQNFNNKRYVDTLTINLANIKNGKIEAYRPKSKV